MRRRRPYELYRRPESPFFYYDFIDRNGRRQRRSTKEADSGRAHEVARQAERRAADPTYRATDDTTIRSARLGLIEHLEQKGRSPDTRKFYENKLAHVERVFGEDAPLAIFADPATVDGYIAKRRAENAHRYTVSKELTAIRMMLRVARRAGKFARELSEVLPVGFATGYVPRTRWLTKDEARQFHAELPEGGVRRYVAFVLATTARDRAAHRAMGKDRTAKGILVRDKKTPKSWRTVPVTPLNEEWVAIAFDGVAEGAQVCPGLGSVRHAFVRAAKRLKVEHVSPNDLRRSVAHWFHEAGVPINVAARFMGHSSIRMLLEVYGQLDTAEVGDAIRRALALGSAK